jgi:hypothetical protein
MTQPTIYIVMGDGAATTPSAIAKEEGTGEVLETVDWGPDGKPNWAGAGICDHRGPGGELGFMQLSMAIDCAEANARAVGFEIERVPKDRDEVAEFMTSQSLADTIGSGLDPKDREAQYALEVLLERASS